jgi:hypothetical protein
MPTASVRQLTRLLAVEGNRSFAIAGPSAPRFLRHAAPAGGWRPSSRLREVRLRDWRQGPAGKDAPRACRVDLSYSLQQAVIIALTNEPTSSTH